MAGKEVVAHVADTIDSLHQEPQGVVEETTLLPPPTPPLPPIMVTTENMVLA